MVCLAPLASVPVVSTLVVTRSPATTVSPLPLVLPPPCLQANSNVVRLPLRLSLGGSHSAPLGRGTMVWSRAAMAGLMHMR